MIPVQRTILLAGVASEVIGLVCRDRYQNTKLPAMRHSRLAALETVFAGQPLYPSFV